MRLETIPEVVAGQTCDCVGYPYPNHSVERTATTSTVHQLPMNCRSISTSLYFAHIHSLQKVGRIIEDTTSASMFFTVCLKHRYRGLKSFIAYKA